MAPYTHPSSNRTDAGRALDSLLAPSREKPPDLSLKDPPQCWPEGQERVLLLLTFFLRLSTPVSEALDASTLTQGCTETLSLSNVQFLLEQTTF